MAHAKELATDALECDFQFGVYIWPTVLRSDLKILYLFVKWVFPSRPQLLEWAA